MKILVCGGAGYIGSHTCVALAARGHEVVIFDNLSNGSEDAVQRVRKLSGRPLAFVEGDVRSLESLRMVLSDGVDAVIHFAALKSVSESCSEPLAYFDNNICGTIRLLQAMDGAGVRNLVFSSSATVYGDPQVVPIHEGAVLQVTNPYGRSKLVAEDLIRDLCGARKDFNATLLRYFNPVGAHPSGLIGEDPLGTPCNLMPYVSQVAVGRRPRLNVFGGDYSTPDGTGVRDYIHVMDLADAHVKAVEQLNSSSGCQAINLGTGHGVSVLELVRAFEQASGRDIPYTIVDRRPGDVAACWADPSKAFEVLGWKAKYGVRAMCEDAWRWQLANPNGYRRH
ncbi:UDP-glucose 4-epimerase GalE [Lysobacter sp. GCM10012299]|uniref:UDP-glucose 4-epimerase GalE n=1 Tax=Lysobacter sp. GCM10012299 TaxID=3317333 RepID=UPI0036174006